MGDDDDPSSITVHYWVVEEKHLRARGRGDGGNMEESDKRNKLHGGLPPWIFIISADGWENND